MARLRSGRVLVEAMITKVPPQKIAWQDLHIVKLNNLCIFSSYLHYSVQGNAEERYRLSPDSSLWVALKEQK
jgi:hypothetical protein